MKNPVVLVHGIKDNSSKMEPMARFLRAKGWDVHTITLHPSWGKIGIDKLALQLEQFIASKIPIHKKIDLIGFSMGGLVSRYYLQRLNGIKQVDRFITLATPHLGTWTAWLKQNTGCKQMRPKSAFLRDLNHDLVSLNQIQFTSFWTPLDLMIIPAHSSCTGIGHEIKVWMPAHPLMVLHPKCIQMVANELER